MKSYPSSKSQNTPGACQELEFHPWTNENTEEVLGRIMQSIPTENPKRRIRKADENCSQEGKPEVRELKSINWGSVESQTLDLATE